MVTYADDVVAAVVVVNRRLNPQTPDKPDDVVVGPPNERTVSSLLAFSSVTIDVLVCYFVAMPAVRSRSNSTWSWSCRLRLDPCPRPLRPLLARTRLLPRSLRTFYPVRLSFISTPFFLKKSTHSSGNFPKFLPTTPLFVVVVVVVDDTIATTINIKPACFFIFLFFIYIIILFHFIFVINKAKIKKFSLSLFHKVK